MYLPQHLQNRQTVPNFRAWRRLTAVGLLGLFGVLSNASLGQTQTPTPDLPASQDIVIPQSEPDLPEIEPFELPPVDDLLEPSAPLDQPPLPTDEVEFVIKQFVFEGNTAFSDRELEDLTAGFIQGESSESQTFADIAAARTAVTDLYVANG